jgi:uncharacterized protein (DUF1330 family)
MVQYLILAKIKDHDLFTQYIKGHIPTIAQFGGKVVFRSTENASILGSEHWDVVAIQEWPNTSAFDLWWDSDAYKPWAQIRDRAAFLAIIKCQNNLPT